MKFSYSLIKKLLPGAPAKTELVEALNLYSFETENLDGDCLDISLASNRYSDAASHLGIAREAGADLGLKLKNPVKEIINPPSNQGFLEVKVENRNLCPRYAARYFEIRKVSSSPLWMQKILKTCGLKPINNVVDSMNYAMLEVGQPLHSFDFDKIKGMKIKNQKSKIKINESKIIFIRKAKNGEKIETLDGQNFTLDSNDLVIADSEKAIAIAGIKGGANSGVDRNTKRIIVEAANFEARGVFRTSRKLKLITDASLRFDHGLSPALVDWGLDRATELLVKAGAKLVDSVDVYSKRAGEELIEFDAEKYEKFIGEPVSVNAAKNYFRALGFSIENENPKIQKSSFLVRIPSWRTDVENFEDLAEEISRLRGYNKLPLRAPAVSLKSAEQEDAVVLKDKIRGILSHFHLDEVYNYSFASFSDARRSGASSGELVELENPVSQEMRYLSPNLERGLLKNIEFNSRFFDTIKIFEIGKTFRKKSDGVEEKLHLGIALSAKKEPLIFELKGIAEELLNSLGITDISFVESGNFLRVENERQVIACLKLVHLEKGPLRRGSSEANRMVSVAEFDLDKILPLIEEKREFKPLPKYPAVVRDISILVESGARIGGILEKIQKASLALIEDVDLIDEYTPSGNLRESAPRSLTFRIVFQAEDRTLTDKEVNGEIKKISIILKEKFGAETR